VNVRFAAAAGAVVAIAVLTAGCGGSGGSKDAALARMPGAKVFKTAGCSGCPTLQAAGAKGQVGPNLDELKPDESTVARQVRVGGNGMPSFKARLSTAQISQVADYVFTAAKSSGQVQGFKPNGTTIADCERTNKPFCFRQAFGNLAYKEGPQKALAELAKDDKSISGVHDDCHQISHWVGHAGLAYYKNDAGVALSHGSMTCNSGYYHGVMQLAFAGLPRPAVFEKAKKLCQNPVLHANEFLLYQCFHGLGHGLMIYSGDDLPWSLKTCHRLPDYTNGDSCTGGVFMLKASNPIYPCNIVSQVDKSYCYLIVTARILDVDHYNWSKTAWWCRRSNKGWVATCFESYGRDASGFTTYHAPRTVRICRLAGRNMGDCMDGASWDYANNYAAGPQSVAICNASPGRFKERCYEGLGTVVGSIDVTAAQRRAGCRSLVERRWLEACLLGAGL
jgi:mono/diheme cytochrome c family protein